MPLDSEAQAETDAREWAEHKDKHDRLRDEARKELDVPEPTKSEPKPEPGRKAAQSRQWEKTPSPEEVVSHVDDYIAGRRRDDPEFEQFAANYGAEIEKEFQRRYVDLNRQPEPESEPDIETNHYGDEIIDMNGPVEPEPFRDEPPPLEPDSYVPDHTPEDRQPEPDLDWEMGD